MELRNPQQLQLTGFYLLKNINMVANIVLISLFSMQYVTWDMFFGICFTLIGIVFLFAILYADSRQNRIFLKIDKLHNNTISKISNLENRVFISENAISEFRLTLNRLLELNRATYNQVHNGKTAEILYRHLKNNQILSVIDQLTAISDLYFDELIQIAAMYNELQQTKTSISDAFYTMEMAKIRSRLVQIIGSINSNNH